MIALRFLLLMCCLLSLCVVEDLRAGEATPAPAATDKVKPAAGATPAAKRIAYVKIDDVINPGKAAYYRQTINTAITAKIDTVMVHLTTPNGRVDSA
ncbi:MAG TPA: hypothetical protein VHX44_14740, partial [Planctomycetota bacterium]|nr:hypothetical protein [Planctomycetota bacterium]